MKRKNVVAVLVLLVLSTAVILWRVSESNPLERLNPDDIREMTISSPAEYFTVTKANDIELMFFTLQSMELRRTISMSKDGFAFLIDIDLDNGERINMTVLSEDVHVDGHNYRPLKDPCDDIRRVFDRLAEKYEVNPA